MSASARVDEDAPRAALEQRAHDLLDLGDGLALGEHRLRRALAQLAMRVDACEAEVAVGQRCELLERDGDVDPAGADVLEQLLDVAAQARAADAGAGTHSPVKVGGRFSPNASTPSRKSRARAQQAVGEPLDLEADVQRAS